MGDPVAVLEAALAGRYRFEALVGRGGMGAVYRAHDLKHDRAVAIKILRPDIAPLLGPERFLREIGIAAQLGHPHIVPLHDSGEVEGHLYYVMPYIAGETLRARLDREGSLPVAEAVRIARQVGEALAHAHARGVIHRDIKPTNILLMEGYALVADFGLARAVSRASEAAELSSVGLPIGTPRYMSPEQAMGARELDGRSDLYSLGCVLHEMLTGTPGPDVADPTPTGGVSRVTAKRAEVPAALSRAVARCLAPRPQERYATAGDFLADLDRAAPAPKRQWLLAGVAGAVVLAVAWVAIRPVVDRVFGGAPATLDTMRIAVFPFERLAGAPALQADLSIRNALGRWSGIGVVGGLEVSDAVKQAGTGPLDRSAASGIARRLGAGRFVRGQLVPFGDSVQVEATVYDSRSQVALLEKYVRLPRDLSGAEAAMPRLVDSLLFRGAIPVEDFTAPPGTSSVPAMWAFIEGRTAVNRWDLPAADSGFVRALTADPGFARAALWLAQVRVWQGQPATTWRTQAAAAATAAARLGSRDSALAVLTSAMSRGEYGTACPRWMALTARWPGDFPVWYGAASCSDGDHAVLRDRASPTGWRFRSSYQQVQRAWRQAFELLPAIYRDFRGGGLRNTQWLLWTSTNRARVGTAVPPDTGVFASYPVWQGDSLAFLPRRLAEMTLARAVRSKASQEAVTQQRLTFYDLATEWASADPRSVEAREARALALWSLGNPSAVDSIREARLEARSAGDRARLGVSEVLMRVLRNGSDSAQVSIARAVADSVLSQDPRTPGVDPWDLATLAALTGRARLAAELVRRGGPQLAWERPALTRDGVAYLAFAALGGPQDSLRVLESRVTEAIASAVNAGDRAAVEREWLGRPLALVPLEMRLPSLARLAGNGDYVIDALSAHARGDSASAMQQLERAQASRAGSAPSDIDFEALLPEAQILSAMGNAAQAIGRLDPTLAELPHVALQQVNNPIGAALLVRAMAMRADLAAATGDDRTAGRWGRTVITLWSSADPHLAPVVARMRRASAGRTN